MFAGQHLPALLFRPGQAPVVAETSNQPVMDLQEMGYVRRGVFELRGGQRAGQPVGQAIALG